jgi:hypothetical protein
MTQPRLAFHNRQHPFRLMFPEFSHVLQILGENDSLRSRSLVFTRKKEFQAFVQQPQPGTEKG